MLSQKKITLVNSKRASRQWPAQIAVREKTRKDKIFKIVAGRSNIILSLVWF